MSRKSALLCATILTGVAATPVLAETPVATAAAAAAAPAATAPTAPYTSAPSGSPATASNVSAATMGEIVVTGSRRATTVLNSPINISAIGEETLLTQRLDDIRDLAAFAPGLTVTDTGPGSTGNIILRGISSGSTSTSGATYNNAVGVYLGEVPLYLDFKLLDINRVEVLEGPQGTLYGLGTLSGAIRYIPNRPDPNHYDLELHARGFGESHSAELGADGDVTLNIPIISDHVAFRSVLGYYDNPGFIDYDFLLRDPGVSSPQPGVGSLGTPAQQAANFYRKKDVNYEHTFTTRNTLLLQANPDLKAYITYANQQTSSDGRQANGAGVLGTGNYVGPWRYLEPTDRKADLFSAELDANLLNLAHVVSSTGYTREHVRSVGDNTDLLLDLDYGYQAFPNFSSYAINEYTQKQFNQEVRVVSEQEGPFSWVLGGFYNNLRTSSLRDEYVPGYAEYAGYDRPDELEYASYVGTDTVEKAVFGELTTKLTSAWQITLGGRYFDYDAKVTGGTALPLFQTYPGVDFSSRSGDTHGSGKVYKLNTSYHLTPNLMAYATYSTGYRVGGVNRVAPCVLPLSPGQNLCALPNELFYKPDRTRNEEIGLRGEFFNHRLQFTVDAFHIGWNNVQVPSQTINGAIGITANGAQAKSDGGEFSGSLKVTRNFTVAATYAYDDAHLTQYVHDLVLGVYDAYPGDRLPGSTRNSGSLSANYTIPLENGARVLATYAATYTGNIYSSVGLRGYGEKIPSYVIHRAAINYDTGKWIFGVFADNIFDKYAITAVSNTYNTLNESVDGDIERYYNRSVLTPRVVGVEGRYKF